MVFLSGGYWQVLVYSLVGLFGRIILKKELPSYRNIGSIYFGCLALPDTYVATHLRQEVGSHSGTGWVATHG